MLFFGNVEKIIKYVFRNTAPPRFRRPWVHGLRGEGLAWLSGAYCACWLHIVGPIVR